MALTESTVDTCSFTGTDSNPWPNTSEGSGWTETHYGSFDTLPTRVINTNRGMMSWDHGTGGGASIVRATDWAARTQSGGRAYCHQFPTSDGSSVYPGGWWARVRNFGSGTTDGVLFSAYTAKGSPSIAIIKLASGTATTIYSKQAAATPTYSTNYHAWRVVNTPDGTKCFAEWKIWDTDEPAWVNPVNSGAGIPLEGSAQFQMWAVIDAANLNGQSGYVGWGSWGAMVSAAATLTVDDFEALEFSEPTGFVINAYSVTNPGA